MSGLATRNVAVVWQDPSTRRLLKVGTLTRQDGVFSFQYTSQVKEERAFAPVADYPSLEETYTSTGIPPFFSNRIMSSARAEYAQYLGWMGLSTDTEDLPLEILVRSGGRRSTDTFHVLEEPRSGDTTYEATFFVSGIRYQPGAEAATAALQEGSTLELVPEPINPSNRNAILLSASGTTIGWVPDWLCEELGSLAKDGWDLNAEVKQVNLDGPMHVRLLCRVTGTRALAHN